MLVKNFFATILLLFCGCACWVLGDDGDYGHVEDDVPVPPIEDLDGMIAYLRHDDPRLIRYSVPR